MDKYINRKEYLDKLLSYKDKDLIKVVSGLRRSGKSTLLELYKKHLLNLGIENLQVQYYNYELPENYLNKTWSDIYFEIKNRMYPDKTNYIFLDEVQNIDSFEKLVDGLYATENTDIYITGSNAFLLSSELATLLSGRYIEISLKLAIAEMYVNGVSTRKVTQITEALCGLDISSSQVSRLSAAMDEELEAFRQRTLSSYAYVYLDARYEKVRHGGNVRDLAVLLAVGANPGKPREVLGVSVSLSEAEVHWRAFLESLSKRGLQGVKLFTSDDHSGLRAARQSVFPSVPWQRCQFHMAQNAQSYIPKVRLKKSLGEVLKSIFNAPQKGDAIELKKRAIAHWQEMAPEWCEWLDDNLEEGLTAFQYPKSHRQRIRTTNGLERLNREIARRTKVAALFPNKESCLRLVTALLEEIHEDWMAGKMYLSIPDESEDADLPFYRKDVA
jgi:putative transposase